MKEGPLALKHFTPLTNGLPTALQKLAHTQSWPVQTAGASTSFTLRRIWVLNFFKHGLEMCGQGFFFFLSIWRTAELERWLLSTLRRWESASWMCVAQRCLQFRNQPGDGHHVTSLTWLGLRSTAVGADKLRSPRTLFMKRCKKEAQASHQWRKNKNRKPRPHPHCEAIHHLHLLSLLSLPNARCRKTCSFVTRVPIMPHWTCHTPPSNNLGAWLINSTTPMTTSHFCHLWPSLTTHESNAKKGRTHATPWIHHTTQCLLWLMELCFSFSFPRLAEDHAGGKKTRDSMNGGALLCQFEFRYVEWSAHVCTSVK